MARSRVLALALLALICGGLLGYYWSQQGPDVTGADPGNWLAFGRGVFGGRGTAAAEAFPPLVPALYWLVHMPLGVMVGGKVLCSGSLLAVLLATAFVLSQSLPRGLVLAATLLVGMDRAVVEPLGFGGWPQNYALAGLLVATGLAVVHLRAGTRGALVGTLFALIVTALSHHIYFILALGSVGLSWALWLRTSPRLATRRTRTLGLGFASLVALLCFLPTGFALARTGYHPPLGASVSNLRAVLEHEVAALPSPLGVMFIFLSIFGMLYLLGLGLSARTQLLPPTEECGLVLGLLAWPLILQSAEERLMPLAVIAGIVGSARAIADLAHAGKGGLALGAVLAISALAIRAVVLPREMTLFRYYRVADAPLLETARWVDQHAPGTGVAVLPFRGSWPSGWWFTALTRADVYTGADIRYLAFPQERDRAIAVLRLLQPGVTVTGVRALAAPFSIRYLIYRPSDWPSLMRWTAPQPDGAPPLTVAYHTRDYVVLDLETP